MSRPPARKTMEAARQRSGKSASASLSRRFIAAAGLVDDPLQAARQVSLRYVTDQAPGLRRQRSGRGFRYVDAEGKTIRDAATLARIHSLAIPPAWTQVWICTLSEGHLQSTGRDARGRKQYRYHPRWRVVRDEAKYARLAQFGAVLPRIRRRVARDLALPGLPRNKVLALLVQLLEMTLIRVGNEEYARANGSFGLTTMRNQHARVSGSTVRFRFRGKSGKLHEVDLEDPRLARLVRRCQELPGHELFQYVDEAGEVHPIGSTDVNDYLREITGQQFTAKDFRTWAGTLLAAHTLIERDRKHPERRTRRAVNQAVREVAQRLGNTMAVCRKCYIHPVVVEGYLAGTLSCHCEVAVKPKSNLRAEEAFLLSYLTVAAGPSKRHAS
jgi:DNA topoisomerase-1